MKTRITSILLSASLLTVSAVSCGSLASDDGLESPPPPRL